MAQKVITVDDSFLIPGGGIVVSGLKEKKSAEIKVGSIVKILRPNRSTIKSQVDAVETFLSRKNPSESQKAENISFSMKKLSKKDVPVGSVIYLIA
jgi:translation elongation factor EF-Tu-like GTPase